jgi:hypothetical protein
MRHPIVLLLEWCLEVHLWQVRHLLLLHELLLLERRQLLLTPSLLLLQSTTIVFLVDLLPKKFGLLPSDLLLLVSLQLFKSFTIGFVLGEQL